MGTKITLDNASAKLATNQTNFPALAHAFTKDSCDFTNKTISCLATDLVIDIADASEFIAVGSNSFSISAGTTQTSSIVATAPEAIDALVVAVYEKGGESTKAVIGEPAATDGIAVTATNAPIDFVSVVTSGATNYHVSAALSLSATADVVNFAVAQEIKWTANASRKSIYDPALAGEFVDGAGVSAGGTLAGGLTQAMLNARPLTEQIQLPTLTAGVTDLRISGVYVLYFTQGMPEDVDAGVAWMSANHGYIFPAWAGRA